MPNDPKGTDWKGGPVPKPGHVVDALSPREPDAPDDPAPSLFPEGEIPKKKRDALKEG